MLFRSASTCSVPTNYAPVGRFPWKTIGTETLRDGSGLVLWYALSSNFRKASGTTVINGDTQGTLTVTGSTSASNVVALIIAPGNALNGQDRSSNTILNYLESASASTTATDTASESFSTAQSSETFNDRLVIVTQADLMAVVEPLVAARIERDVKEDTRRRRRDADVRIARQVLRFVGAHVTDQIDAAGHELRDLGLAVGHRNRVDALEIGRAHV